MGVGGVSPLHTGKDGQGESQAEWAMNQRTPTTTPAYFRVAITPHPTYPATPSPSFQAGQCPLPILPFGSPGKKEKKREKKGKQEKKGKKGMAYTALERSVSGGQSGRERQVEWGAGF